MASHLLQIKRERDSDLALTENGFTVREEKRLLKAIREGEAEFKKGKMIGYHSMAKTLQVPE